MVIALELDAWEIGWLSIISFGLFGCLFLMLIWPERFYFLLSYVIVFGLNVFPLLFALGQSEVDGQHSWAKLGMEWFEVKKKMLKGSKQVYTGNRKGMFITNHSSLADLCLAELILEGRCNNIARHMVVFFIPLPSIVVLFLNTIWFFRRGGRGNDLENFFVWLDSNFNWFLTQRHHINVFPEGHRNRKPYSKPLK